MVALPFVFVITFRILLWLSLWPPNFSIVFAWITGMFPPCFPALFVCFSDIVWHFLNFFFYFHWLCSIYNSKYHSSKVSLDICFFAEYCRGRCFYSFSLSSISSLMNFAKCLYASSAFSFASIECCNLSKVLKSLAAVVSLFRNESGRFLTWNFLCTLALLPFSFPCLWPLFTWIFEVTGVM